MNFDQASQGFAAAGAASRLAVLKKLVRTGPDGMTVGTLQKKLNMPASTLAHHLKHLSDSGLIEQKKIGREVINIARFNQIKALANFLLSECCVDSETQENCF
jgi:ArsR family transcriptional regulator